MPEEALPEPVKNAAPGDFEGPSQPDKVETVSALATANDFNSEGRSREVLAKLKKLQIRIKNTSSVRFSASKRIRFDYKLAQLTIVILSLWSITISFLIAMNNMPKLGLQRDVLEPIGILLPVFIVAFSLIENGETYLRGHQLEMCARQLRELGDKLYTEIELNYLSVKKLIEVYNSFSQTYNDILERSPANHDDIDHWARKYSADRDAARHRLDSTILQGGYISSLLNDARISYIRNFVIWLAIFVRRQFKRIFYIGLWAVPLTAFFIELAP